MAAELTEAYLANLGVHGAARGALDVQVIFMPPCVFCIIPDGIYRVA